MQISHLVQGIIRVRHLLLDGRPLCRIHLSAALLLQTLKARQMRCNSCSVPHAACHMQHSAASQAFHLHGTHLSPQHLGKFAKQA